MESSKPISVAHPAGWLGRAAAGLRLAGRVAGLALRKSVRDELLVQASALAFSTVLAFVPLLAAFLFVGEHVFVEYRQQVVNILREALPYSEDRILAVINQFLAQAARIRGFGLAGFVAVALLTFASIESTLNRIWNVTAGRPWRTRLYSFLMLLLWGPLLIGAAYSTLALLRRQTAFDRLWHESIWLAGTPFLVTAIGLTMLYWIVPHATVRFRSALIGGVAAAFLLELLRYGFKLYLLAVPGMNLVYGTFALLLFFMISIEAAWLIALLGSEVAYAHQHHAVMDRLSHALEPIDGAWLGLIALLASAEKGERNECLSLPDLAGELDVPIDGLQRAVAPLIAAGLLRGEAEEALHVRSAAQPERLEVQSVLALYEGPHRRLLAPLSPAVSAHMDALRRRLLQARRDGLSGITVRQLIGDSAEPAAGTAVS